MPYLYFSTRTMARSEVAARNASRLALQKHGFKLSSPVSAWEQFGFNADTLILVSSVSMASGKTYVQVLATSDEKSPAETWPNELMTAIEKTHQID